jgi:hypothetical protein
METEKSPETRHIAENTYVQSAAESVKLVEMGAVSVETKGFVRGLELGLTPKS